MIYPIVAYGDPVLRRQAEEIGSDYPDLKQLVADMFETMEHAGGVGLAAPQIGLSIKLIVVDATPFASEDPAAGGFRKALLNPEIYAQEGEEWAFNEGCLSFPGLHEDVYRPSVVHIRYMDETGLAHDEVYDGYVARVLQHECDHLNGKTFVDHLSPLRKALLRRKLDCIAKGAVSADYKMKFVGKPKHR
ncbi:MAG: peptide deformylase [Bacteroidales bacterium]|nr:peptide deformylase [Bacteroidales bacterium]MDE7071977.1 peptide deformylase [Bacteroidales bacterium]